jgi:glyoxylate/hydroxypyruvate reductase A
MRIQIQNLEGMIGERLTMDEWTSACDRAGIALADHQVTIGHTLDDYAAAAPTMEALFTSTTVTKVLFPAEAPQLKLLFCTSAGLDPVPFGSLPPGVKVLNNRGVHGPKAGEFGIMALLMLCNQIPGMVTDQFAQQWNRSKRHSGLIVGQKLTVVGVGSLGGATAERAKQFGMKVTGVRTNPVPHPACDRVVATADLDSVLPDTDYLFLACPLTHATRNILSKERIALLPPHAGVVNIGRGPLVDQDALCDALDAGRLSGAVLDVFVPEPVPPGHRLWTTANLVMTPHVSSDDRDAYNARSFDVFLTNLKAFLAGKPLPNLFDTVRGY